MYCVQFWLSISSKDYFKSNPATPTTNGQVLTLSSRANQKKTRHNFWRVIWLARKKMLSEGMTAVYTYIGGNQEGKPRTTLNKKTDVRFNSYTMAMIKFRLELNKDPSSSQAHLAVSFKSGRENLKHFQNWLKCIWRTTWPSAQKSKELQLMRLPPVACSKI